MPANNSDAVITTPVRMPYLAGFGLGWPRQLYGLCQARTCRPKLPCGLVKPTLGITAWHARNTSSERPGIIYQMTNSRYKGLSSKTVSRKLTALGNYFQWFVGSEAIPSDKNPMLNIANTRVSSPLPEILFETECAALLTTASSDPRTHLSFLLFLETGIKLEELFALKVSHFDFSNRYAPEMHIKHTGKKEKKSRKLKLPVEIIPVFNDYVAGYRVDNVLFPYTPRFVRYLITEAAEKAGVKKKVSAQILRDTCAIRQLRRGEGIERVLMRLGLSETTWEDAKVKYEKLSKGGI